MFAQDLDRYQKLFHPLILSSHKEHLVPYSPIGANILAAADSYGLAYDLDIPYDYIFVKKMIRHEILFDSLDLFYTITTVHEPREYRLKNTVAKIRDMF